MGLEIDAVSVKLNGDNGEYWKAIADPKPPEPLSEVLRKYMDGYDECVKDAIEAERRNAESLRYFLSHKRQRRILNTPYPPRGEMFVDWCPVPKEIVRIPEDCSDIKISRYSSSFPIPLRIQHEMLPVTFRTVHGNDPHRGTLHHRRYGWEPETKTLVLGPERIEACEHVVSQSLQRPTNHCWKCGFDLAKARRLNGVFSNGLSNQSIGFGIAGGLSNAYQPPFKQWYGYGLHPTATESDPIEKTSKAACDHNFGKHRDGSGRVSCIHCGMDKPKADPATCEHDWPQCGCPPNTSPIGECTKCGTPYLSWELRERFHRNMTQRRRNARKPRRGLLWRMRAINYKHIAPRWRNLKAFVFELFVVGWLLAKLLTHDVAAAARRIWSLVPKPVPGRRWRSGWEHLSEEERGHLFRDWN